MIVEVVQAVSAVSVPIVVAVIGYKLNQRLKLYEASQWRNQELIKARLQYFDQLAPMLNDLMCYLTFVGRWKELTPPDVIALKRDIDRLFYIRSLRCSGRPQAKRTSSSWKGAS